jgi:hypothetical protein
METFSCAGHKPITLEVFDGYGHVEDFESRCLVGHSLTRRRWRYLRGAECIVATLGRASTSFGCDYIIPLPLDSEVLPGVAAAVAGAAMRTGAASRPVTDLTAYSDAVATRVRLSHEQRPRGAPAKPEACLG